MVGHLMCVKYSNKHMQVGKIKSFLVGYTTNCGSGGMVVTVFEVNFVF